MKSLLPAAIIKGNLKEEVEFKLDLGKHAKFWWEEMGEDEHSSQDLDQGMSGEKLYKIVGVKAEILCRWGMRYNSGKVDWGHSVLSLVCQVKESLFARLSGATDNFASREWLDRGKISGNNLSET